MTKTENGMEFPAEAYLVVPDPDSPSTWKLRIWETPEAKITRAQLGRAAAALGPGFRGNRVDLTDEERRAAARRLIRLYHQLDVEDEEIPEYLFDIAGVKANLSEEDVVEREAMLFEAGSYPDKGIEVTEDDLDRIIRSHQQDEIPIFVEHAPSPLRLGKVGELFRRGKQLWGKLRLLPEASALLDKLGVHGVSITIPRTLDRIIEVSITGRPRVAGARVFSENLTFSLGETPSKEVSHMTDKELQQILENERKNFLQQLEEERKKFAALVEEERQKREEAENMLRFAQASTRVDELIRAGKMPPAFRDVMIAALVGKANYTFSDTQEEVAIGEALLRVFSQMPSLTAGALSSVPVQQDFVQSLRSLGFDEQTAKFAAELQHSQRGR